MAELTVSDMMRAYAEDCTDLAREQHGLALDYSENSLTQVEGVLDRMHKALPKGPIARLAKRGPSEEQIQTMAKAWGAYLGEVMRRQWDGEWTTETAAQPGDVLTLRVGGTDLFPVAKVYRRLKNGAEDNVWHYYQVLKRDFAGNGANVR